MKVASSVGINIGRQDKAQLYQGTSIESAARLRWQLGMMVFVLTFGLIAAAQQPNQTASGFQRTVNLTACSYSIGQCDEGLLSPAEAAQVGTIRHRLNVQACGYGFGQCDETLLSPAEAAQASAIRHRMNVQACGYGVGKCRDALLTSSEAASVRSTKARQGSIAIPYPLPTIVEIPTAAPTSFDTQISALLNALLNSVSPSVAENGSYYGEPNKNGVPKTVLVNGYTRSNGTYVQGYYRSAPGTNPIR